MSKDMFKKVNSSLVLGHLTLIITFCYLIITQKLNFFEAFVAFGITQIFYVLLEILRKIQDK